METLEKNTRPGSSAWKALLGRAVLALDEEGISAYRKRKDALERKLERNLSETGLTVPPYDFYMVQEVLVEYDKCGIFTEAIRNCGAKESECIEARVWDADIKLVWDFVRERIKARLAARASDIAQEAQEGLRRLVTDEECKLNVKALKMALESVAPELYGGDAKGSGDEEESDDSRKKIPMSGGIMINIIGDAAAKLEAPKGGGKSGGVYIDV
jgi:hypothetical protein